MSSITIHKLDEDLDRRIRAIAREDNTSLNKTIKRLLRERLDMESGERQRRRASFRKYCGLWSAEKEEEFLENVGEFERIDRKEWQ